MKTYFNQKTRVLRQHSFEYLDRNYPYISHQMRYMKNVSLRLGEPELQIIDKLVKPNGVVIDVGAHRGVYTQVFANKAKIVHAFEPVPLLSDYLRKVMPSNVTVYPIALSDQIGMAKLRIPYRGGYFGLGQGTIEISNDLGGRDPAEIEIRTDTIDHFLAGEESEIDFIKIDVEGHEESVLRGALQRMRQCRPIIMAEIEVRYNPRSLENIFKMLRELGYDGYFLKSGRRLMELDKFSIERDQDRGKIGTPDYVNNFIFSASPIMI